MPVPRGSASSCQHTRVVRPVVSSHAFFCWCLCGGVWQSAECVGLFPLPVARPGFYPLSLEEYASCVPAEACPGVDSAALRNAFTWPAGNGTLGCVLL
jgi:hypothetical protein